MNILRTCSLFFVLLLHGCSEKTGQRAGSGTPSQPLALHADDESYVQVDTAASLVAWKGSNTFGAHNGSVFISQGELKMEDGSLKGGTFEIDMRTIEDERHDRNSGLIKHLKDPDFFDVDKFPFATIAITEVAANSAGTQEIRGDLTIKGISNPVSFPARIDVSPDVIRATARLVIDRTQWGIRYGSGKFFDNLKDQTISDSIEFDITVVARPKGQLK